MTLPHSFPAVQAVEQLLAMYDATHEESLIGAVCGWRVSVSGYMKVSSE